jgi:hypothetical protein
MMPILIKTTWDDRAVEQAVDEAIASGRTKIKASRMKLGDYNGFSGDQRVLADRKHELAEAGAEVESAGGRLPFCLNVPALSCLRMYASVPAGTVTSSMPTTA